MNFIAFALGFLLFALLGRFLFQQAVMEAAAKWRLGAEMPRSCVLEKPWYVRLDDRWLARRPRQPRREWQDRA